MLDRESTLAQRDTAVLARPVVTTGQVRSVEDNAPRRSLTVILENDDLWGLDLHCRSSDPASIVDLVGVLMLAATILVVVVLMLGKAHED